MTRYLAGVLVCFVLVSSAHADEVVIHERARAECRDEPVEWKLTGEQSLGIVLTEMSRLFCDTYFVDRALVGEKIELHVKLTEAHGELRERLRAALRAEGVDLDASMSYQVTKPMDRASAVPALDTYSKDIHCKAGQCEVTRAFIQKLLSNTAALGMQARLVPSVRDGKPNGFKLYAIRPGSVFALFGFQNGDTIQTVNGADFTTPDKALEVYTKLRAANHLLVAGESRRGEPFSIDITIRN